MALNDPASIDDLLLYRLSRVVSVGGSAIIRLCEGGLGITWREWRLIAVLGPQSALLSSELASHARLDRARTSRAISSLSGKGLIAREPVPGDQRKVRVRLTDSGRQLHASFFPVAAQLNARLLHTLGPDDLAVLDRVLTEIQLQADAVQRDPDLPKADRRRGRRSVPADD